MSEDEQFAAMVAEHTARIPGVVAVALGGSRAQGSHRLSSDFDFGLYYRGRLDPDDVRALGWPGEMSEIGGWGGGVMNGGAWLTVGGRRVDLHYRDLDEVEHWLAEAEEGRFDIQRLLFYLAGIPTYVVVGEVAVAQVLSGVLPRPGFPAGLLAQAVLQAAHGRVAAAGVWALNEKRLVEQAGLAYLTGRFARLGDRPEELHAAVEEVRAALLAPRG